MTTTQEEFIGRASLLQDEWLEDRRTQELYAERFFSSVKEHLKIQNVEESHLRERYKQYQEEALEFKSKMATFQRFMEQTPLVVPLLQFVRKWRWQQDQRDKIMGLVLMLIEQNVLRLKEDAKLITLSDFRRTGHQKIIEDIRCVKKWSLNDRERIVECYLQFSSYLENDTFGLFQRATDPDRQRVMNKTVRYDMFMDFVQLLPFRDAIISKLIYFGAPSITDVLSLQVKHINFIEQLITYNDKAVSYPKHVLSDLQEIVKESLPEFHVFTTLRHTMITKAHLNHAFERAFVKARATQKFSPGDLLR